MTTSSELLTGNQPITISLASLASGSYQQSAAIDNTSNLYLDAAVQLSVKAGGSGVSATGTVNVYAYGSANGGANYTDGASGNNASFNPTSPTNLKLLGVINANGNSQTFIATAAANTAANVSGAAAGAQSGAGSTGTTGSGTATGSSAAPQTGTGTASGGTAGSGQ